VSGELRVADLPAADHAAAVGVLARGMRDNPLHVAAFGPDPERREIAYGRLMRAFLRHARHNEPIAAYRDGTLVALAGALSQGGCRPDARQQLRLLPTVAGIGPRTAVRMGRWMKTWQEHDPEEPHVHLGPVAVDRHLQGQGVGSVLLAEHARRLDAAGALGYLETDKRENVRFYERHGYVVVGEAEVIGVPNWFMERRPRGARAGGGAT
jgi:ribosomal protein S18 acetylase RimI-like enzyme